MQGPGRAGPYGDTPALCAIAHLFPSEYKIDKIFTCNKLFHFLCDPLGL